MSSALRFSECSDVFSIELGRRLAAVGCGLVFKGALRACAINGVEDVDELDVWSNWLSFSKSDAFVGGDEPRGEGFSGELVVLCRESLDVELELWLASESRCLELGVPAVEGGRLLLLEPGLLDPFAAFTPFLSFSSCCNCLTVSSSPGTDVFGWFFVSTSEAWRPQVW